MEISSANKYLLLILSTDKQLHLNAILNFRLVFKAGSHSYNKYHSPRSFQQIEFSILKISFGFTNVPEKQEHQN
jgi:hypothetical protein